MVASPTEAFTPREVCFRCMRPARVCWCRHVPSIASSTRTLFLQHPREEFMPIGTARMAAACLPRASLVVGEHLDQHPQVRAILDDPREPPVLLWPGPGARDLARDPPAGPVTLVVVDGTWALAKKLIRLNPRVASLPRYALAPDEPSRYRIRREPRAECVSTLEAVMHALGVLEGEPERFRAMLAPFSAMIDMQIAEERRTQGAGRLRRPRPPKPKPLPPEILQKRSIVAVVGEANAFPRRVEPGYPEGTPPDELVQWLAVRMDDGAVFEEIVAPRNELAPGTCLHTELDREVLSRGVDVDTFLDRWRAFVREDDVITAWGYYAMSVLPGSASSTHRFFDLRRAVTRWIGKKPGSIETYAARTGRADAPLGRGRGGRRLALTRAVVHELLAAAAGR